MPSRAVTTSKPSRVSRRVVNLRTVSESSTTITSLRADDAAALAALGGEALVFVRVVADDARPLRKLHRIDDQHDLAGAEHRRAGNAGHARELRTDVLHDDFLVADHFVDVDGRRPLAAAYSSTAL